MPSSITFILPSLFEPHCLSFLDDGNQRLMEQLNASIKLARQSPLQDHDMALEASLSTSGSSSLRKRSTPIENLDAKSKNETLLEDLTNIKISLGYLRNSDTSSPNFEYKFYYSKEKRRIVFNLLHPAIHNLINYRDPSLAAHRALCLALTEDKNGILQDLQINPKVIDALLAFDLLARFKAKDTLPYQAMLKRFNDIMDNYN